MAALKDSFHVLMCFILKIVPVSPGIAGTELIRRTDEGLAAYCLQLSYYIRIVSLWYFNVIMICK